VFSMCQVDAPSSERVTCRSSPKLSRSLGGQNAISVDLMVWADLLRARLHQHPATGAAQARAGL
jgi:hypothetical protein